MSFTDPRFARVVEDYEEGMLNVLRPQCKTCAHYQGYVGGAHRCIAFPVEIPVIILTNEWDHHEPFPGDGGITYQERTSTGD